MSASAKITCPNCKFEFNAEEVLSIEIEKKLKIEFNQKYTNLVGKKEKEMEEKEKNIGKLVNEGIQAQKTLLEKEIKEKLETENLSKIKLLEDEQTESRQKIADLRVKEIENEKLKRQLTEQKQTIELDFQRQMSEKLLQETERIKTIESERSQLNIKEKDEKLRQLSEKLEEMKRKMEQGSMQMQGEVAELLLADLLKEIFPFDEIQDVPKGVKGADLIQNVRNNFGQSCGKIIFESKRTKAWDNDWVEKLKVDSIATQADIAVIVTQSMPKDTKDLHQRDGVWVCSFSEVKSLVKALRDGLIKINLTIKSQENKGDKMVMLYNYLTSNEFKQGISAIREGFLSMKMTIQKERDTMEKMWKFREKQLEKVLINTSQIDGSIMGIAGSSVPDFDLLGNNDDFFKIDE
ncbi:MAG: DUF2130 domain-containing protein [Bacteroidetes bacterium]|jgi:hypothetical protein|nr:DUF2130 domain-containing protein [Bacteroidota bacterium]MBK9633249.1 DUF2130 domain-containing protein [Bacteroidota bacterium]MBL0286260.1 DUF2130 domain-containing protein [Bacteroidota bacterium]MBP7256666.1 DUF2130 domain-containing protein [Chitinophagales bacterium]MBP9135451.1 DUF2130 domain-containing protein [Chitinophagales bacterium]